MFYCTQYSFKYLVLLFYSALHFVAFSQIKVPARGVRMNSTTAAFAKQSELDIPSLGGKYLPSKGNIRAIAIFVQLKNDTVQDEKWKLNEMPTWVDELSQNVYNYFDEMSFNQLKINVDIYPKLVKTDYTETDYAYTYRDVERYGYVNKEVLKKVDDDISFLPYDNWNRKAIFSFVEGQDYYVDLVLIIYRSLSRTEIIKYWGISDLGFTFKLEVDNGKRIIWDGDNPYEKKDASSSGVTICKSPGSGLVMDCYSAEKLLNHEIGHKFVGEGHPIYNFASLGLMSNINGGEGMHSYERRILGYINFITYDLSNSITLSLKDYMSTGQALIIPIPGLFNQYYILENRQGLSKNDGAPSKGLYIYQLNFSGGYSSIDIQSADGKWTWILDSESKPVKDTQDVITGKTHLELVDINNVQYFPPEMAGNQFDAFKIGYKTEYAPWTNPSSNGKRGLFQDYPTGALINLLEESFSNIKIKISNISGITDIRKIVDPEKIELLQNYPNPFNSSTKIGFNLIAEGLVELKIYDVLGREVTTLINDFKQPGIYNINFNADNLSGGIYYYQLKVGNFIETKKLVLLK